MPHTFVGRTPASAAGPLAGHPDLIETSTSRARAPGAGQGTRPTLETDAVVGFEEGMSALAGSVICFTVMAASASVRPIMMITETHATVL